MADLAPTDPPPLPPINDNPPGDPRTTKGPPPDEAHPSIDLAERTRQHAGLRAANLGPTIQAELPTAQRALDWMRERLGMGEQPPGSNCNWITNRFGIGCVAWCCETVSLAWNYAFGNVDVWSMAIQADYITGIAFVPNCRIYFQQAGRYFSAPMIGAGAVCVFEPGLPIGDHIGLVESWVDRDGNQRTDTFDPGASDGTVVMLDGNFGNDLIRIRRSMSLIDGYCLPPYADSQEDDMFTDADRQALDATRKVAEHLERWGDLADGGSNPGGTAHEAVMARLGAIEAKIGDLAARVDAIDGGGSVTEGTLDVVGTVVVRQKK